MQSIGLMVFWLVVVLALIPVSLWLLKRSGWTPAGGGGAPTSVLKTVGQASLGPGQRVVTVELDANGQRTWLVLGVTAQQVTALHTLPAPALTDAPPAAPTMPLGQAFAQVLRRKTQPDRLAS